MKLQRLVVKNFLGIFEADIDLSRPVNLILGRNGTGKSSLRDAIEYALIGRCRSTDAAGRGADSLIRRGSDGFQVRLTVKEDGEERSVTRGRNGAGPSGAKGSLFAEIPPGLVEALLDMPHLLRMGPRERSELLSALISPAVDLQDVQRHAEAMRLSEGALASLLSGLRKVSPGPYGPDELAQAYKLCYEARTKRKRDLADTEAKLQAMPVASGGPLWADTVRQRLQLIEADEAGLREQMGALRQKQAEWNRAQARRLELEKQLADMVPQETAPQETMALEPSVEGLEREAARLGEVHANLKEIHKAAWEKRVRTESESESAVRRAEQASAGDTSCPAHVTTDPCPVLEARAGENQGQLEALVTAAKKASTAAKRARAAELAAGAELDAAAAALEHADAALAAAREAAARSDGSAEASVDAIQAELDRIEADYPSDAVANAELPLSEKRLGEIVAKKTAAQEELRAIEAAARSAEERKQLEGTAASVRKVVATLEELVPALEPRGLPARILAERIGPFEERINEQLATITRGEYRVAIRAERGIDMDVYRSGSGLALPPENLSTSERLRLGVALAQSVAILSGLGFIVIDEGEMLDQVNRGLLMRGVMALAGQIETTLVLATVDRPTTATSDTIGVHWVEDGRVTPVVAAEPAGVA